MNLLLELHGIILCQLFDKYIQRQKINGIICVEEYVISINYNKVHIFLVGINVPLMISTLN